MSGTFLFLGTGGSAGIPVIGCKCSTCTSLDPKNKRLRPAGLLSVRGKKLLIDVGPDFRQQALSYGIDHVDGLVLTHTHYDHIAGIDELRIFYLRTQQALPTLLSRESFEDLRDRYPYLFQPLGEVPTLSAQLEFQILEEERGRASFLGIDINYVSYFQGHMKVLGYRWGNFAYVSDIKEYDPSIFHSLEGVEILILSALREEPSPLHLSVADAIAFATTVGAKKTYLTHLSHAVDAREMEKKLPPGIFLGQDGLELEIRI